MDGSGRVYLAGSATGSVTFGPDGSSELLRGPTDPQSPGFLLRLDRDGEFLGAHQLGAGGGAYAEDVALDAVGNVYLTGHFIGTADFDPQPGRHRLTSAGKRDALFLWKLSAPRPLR